MAEQIVIDPDKCAAIDLGGAEYFVSPKTDAKSLISDIQTALSGASETVHLMAIELGSEGSQSQADPDSVSRILFGVHQLLKVAQGAALGVEMALYRADPLHSGAEMGSAS